MLLIGVLLTLMLPAALSEVLQSGECGENVTWTMDDQGTLTISGSGPMEDYATLEDDGWWLTSPPYWDWNPDVSTEESRRQIKRVVVEPGVTSIGGGAFRDLDGMEQIEIASTVNYIGGWAFDSSTAFQEITLPEGLERIVDSTFSDCHSLAVVNIPESVEAIEAWAFYNTALTEVTIPAAVNTIGERAFYECTALRAFNVSANNPTFKSVGGALFTRDGTEMLCYGSGHTESYYAIPEGVRVLYPSTFSYCEALEEVHLPDSLRVIHDWAFGHTGLKRVTVPSGVTTIDYCAFGACEQLETVTLPGTLTEVGVYVFKDSPVRDAYYGGTLEQWISFGIEFDDTSDALIHFTGDGIEDDMRDLYAAGTCGEDLRWALNAHHVLIISGTGAMDAYHKESVTHYDSYGRPSYTESWYTYPWWNVSGNIQYVEIREGVTSTGWMSFCDIYSIKRVSLPLSLSYVANYSFHGTGLTDVYYAGSQEQWSAFGKGANNTPLTSATFHWNTAEMDIIYWHFSDGVLTVSGSGEIEVNPPWRASEEVMTQARQLIIQEGITVLGEDVFSNMHALEQVSLPESLKEIGPWCFYDCPALGTIAIPAGVTRIGERALYECTALASITVSADNAAYKSVNGSLFTKDGKGMISYGAGHTASAYTVPEGVEWLEASTFSYSAALREVQLPDSLQVIGNWAFGHTGLERVVIPPHVKGVESRAFSGCENLTQVTIPVSVQSFDVYVFDDSAVTDIYFEGTQAQWNELVEASGENAVFATASIHFGTEYPYVEKALTLPAGLTTIQESAFWGDSFTHVYLGENVATIGDYAFAWCTDLRYIYIPDATTSISEEAFVGDLRMTIGCHANSAAYRFAVAHGLKYELK